MGRGDRPFTWLAGDFSSVFFHLHSRYGVDVHGVDLASNMIAIAQDYRLEMEAEVKHRVQFYIEDATLMCYPKNFYDVVYR